MARPTLTTTPFPYTTLFRSAKVIQSDPALTGRLLQIANSALSGGARPCATVKEATMRLGLRAVRSVALGFSLVSRSEEHTSELQSLTNLVCRLLLEKKKHRC